LDRQVSLAGTVRLKAVILLPYRTNMVMRKFPLLAAKDVSSI